MTADTAAWLAALRRYALITAGGHALWEVVQLPLYTIWHQGTAAQIGFAAVHCWGGDLLIAAAVLLAALLAFGRGWPDDATAARNVTVTTLALGFAYTVFSEWLNVNIRQAWAYSDWMPVLPPLGTGLSPLLQWVVVPSLALRHAHAVK